MWSVAVCERVLFHSPIRFSTYEDLVMKIESDPKWSKDLNFSYFRICYKLNEKLYVVPADLVGVRVNKRKLANASTGLSAAVENPFDFRSTTIFARSLYKTVAQIPCDDIVFLNVSKYPDKRLMLHQLLCLQRCKTALKQWNSSSV